MFFKYLRKFDRKVFHRTRAIRLDLRKFRICCSFFPASGVFIVIFDSRRLVFNTASLNSLNSFSWLAIKATLSASILAADAAAAAFAVRRWYKLEFSITNGVEDIFTNVRLKYNKWNTKYLFSIFVCFYDFIHFYFHYFHLLHVFIIPIINNLDKIRKY